MSAVTAQEYRYVTATGAHWGTRQRRPDGSAIWLDQARGFPPLYNADALSVLPPGSTVRVCRSEPDADASDIPATCFPIASWMARRAMIEAAELLRGQHVLVDRGSSPADADWFRLTASVLSGIAASVRPYGSETSVLEIVDGRWLITIPGTHADLRAEAANLVVAGREFHCRLRISWGSDDRAWQGDLNVRSQSARESLARALKTLWGDSESWQPLVHELASRLEFIGRDNVRPVHWSQFPRTATDDLVQNLVCDRSVTILFGTGATLKSMVALSIAATVASGRSSYLGLDVNDNGPVLWIDYEDPGVVPPRLEAICRGLGIDASRLPLYVVDPRGQAITDLADHLRTTASEITPRLVVVDSAMHACRGPAEDAGAATETLRACQSLGAPVLLISHTNRADNIYTADWGEPGKRPDHPYGNVVWRNLARRCLYQRTLRGVHGYAVEILETKSNSKAGFVNGCRLLITFGEDQNSRLVTRIGRPGWLEGLTADETRARLSRRDP